MLCVFFVGCCRLIQPICGILRLQMAAAKNKELDQPAGASEHQT